MHYEQPLNGLDPRKDDTLKYKTGGGVHTLLKCYKICLQTYNAIKIDARKRGWFSG